MAEHPRPHPIALLTGAGFTHNFGGFLADQLWEQIYNHPKVSASANLRKLMRDEAWQLNFEKIFAHLKSETSEHLAHFSLGLETAYADLDKIVIEAKDAARHEIGLTNLREWLRRFESEKGQGYIFSLNQDLMFERMARDAFVPYLPLVPAGGQCLRVQSSETIVRVKLPPDITKEQLQGDLQRANLIKLHGSCNWESSDGKNLMVIGEGKEDAIGHEPLLKAYWDLFKEVLLSAQQLWVIGYGFGDVHINSVVADAIRDKKLRMYVLSPSRPKGFLAKLREASRGSDLVEGLCGFIPNSLKGVFPLNRPESQPLRVINGLMNS